MSINFDKNERGILCLSLSPKRIIVQNNATNTGVKRAMSLIINKYFYKDKKFIDSVISVNVNDFMSY